MTALTIVFPIYPGVTPLEYTGPLQVLARLPGARAIVASIGGQPIETDGMVFGGLTALETVTSCDVLCVPGGYGTIAAIQDAAYMAAIRRLAATAKYVTSVCTGSLILAAAGLLRGKQAACHWAWRERLADFGAIPHDGRVVRDGNILTGGGVTAGIDFALTLVAEIAGADAAQAIQLTLEYAPAPPFNSGRPDLAPPAILARVQAMMHAAAPERDATLRRLAATVA